MKNIKELSDKAILALTDEQLDKMVKLQMAENGIKILEYPKEPTYEEVPKKDVVAYEVVGFTHKFKNKDVADKLSSAIQSIKISEFFSEGYRGSDYSNKYLKQLEDFYHDTVGTVKKSDYYTVDDITKINELKTKNEGLKKAFEYELDEYNSEQEKVSEVVEDIYGVYRSVRAKYDTMNDLKRKYEQYLSLADGNAKTAIKFLKNAYSIDAETEKYVVDGVISDRAPVQEAIISDGI